MKTVSESTACAHRKQQQRERKRQDLVGSRPKTITTTILNTIKMTTTTATTKRSWLCSFVCLFSLLIVGSDSNNSKVGVLAKRVTGLPYNPSVSNAQSSNSLINAQQQQYSSVPIVQPRCPNGAPLQWRPYLDAASKAHLAPAVALGSLKLLSLTPVQLANGGGGGSAISSSAGLPRTSASQLPAYHPQNVNNAGVNLEATFTISAVPKRAIASMNLRPGQTIKLLYRVSASLSTTNALMTLVNSNTMSTAAIDKQQHSQALSPGNVFAGGGQTTPAFTHHHQQWNPFVLRPKPASMLTNEMARPQAQAATCTLDLSEHELIKKVDKIFKVNQNYILFLDQASAPIQPATLRRNLQQQAPTYRQQQQQVAGASGHHHQQLQQAIGGGIWTQASYVQSTEASLYPFATHELLTNQTGRALHRILCKGCAQVPHIQLVNATVVSVVAQQPPAMAGSSSSLSSSLVGNSAANSVGSIQQAASGNPNLNSAAKNRIKLDCRVAGFPAPWIQWYKNGKLLRAKRGKVSVRANKWRRRHDIRVSRLEIDLPAGRNETGIYECRAMNVVAREPVVGTYTLLVRPTHYALIPMQAPASLQDSTQAGAQAAERGAGSMASSVSAAPEAVAPASNTPPNRPQATGGHHQNATQIGEKATTTTAAATTTTITTVQVSNSSSSIVSTTRAPTGQQGSISTATVGSTQPTTAKPSATNTPPKQQDQQQAATTTNNNLPASSAESADAKKQQQKQSKGRQTSRGSPSPVVGQPCPREAHDNFCLNKGTCVLIGHIEEYFCNCAEGYHGHRCEYKSLGHQQAPH